MNIKREIPKGTNERHIYLPPEEFTYGRKNRAQTPVKDVINYEFSKKAEEVINKEYEHFMQEVIFSFLYKHIEETNREINTENY